MALTFVDTKPPRPKGADDAPSEGMKWPPCHLIIGDTLLLFVMWELYIPNGPAMQEGKSLLFAFHMPLPFPPYGLPHNKTYQKYVYTSIRSHIHDTYIHHSWEGNLKHLVTRGPHLIFLPLQEAKGKHGVGQRKSCPLRCGRHYLVPCGRHSV
jgi:hypothetical protein